MVTATAYYLQVRAWYRDSTHAILKFSGISSIADSHSGILRPGQDQPQDQGKVCHGLYRTSNWLQYEPNRCFRYGFIHAGVIDSYTWAVIALFVLMGYEAFFAGFGKDLYCSAYKRFGHMIGGLGIGTVGASTGFAAIVGKLDQQQLWQLYPCQR